MRRPKVHDLKIDKDHFKCICMEHKLVEVRFDDRGFAQGDYLFLRETTYTGKEMTGTAYPLIYTGCTAMVQVIYIHADQGMAEGWVAMSIKLVNKATGGKYGLQ